MSECLAEKKVDVVIIGGGISGLAAAWYTHQANRSCVVLEQSERFGGNIHTETHAHIPLTVEDSSKTGTFQLETGPHTIPASSHHLLQLCQELGLHPLETSPAAKNRYIYLNPALAYGENASLRKRRAAGLYPVPMSVPAFLSTPLLSDSGKAYLLGEWFRGYRSDLRNPTVSYDPSVAEVIRHRLGDEVLNHMVAPFITGVYAGNPEQLSFEAVFPSLASFLKEQRSFTGGAFAKIAGKLGGKSSKTATALPVAKKRKGSTLLSLPGGLTTLVEALVSELGDKNCRRGVTVTAINPEPHGVRVTCNTRKENGDEHQDVVHARHVVVATPAFVAAELLQTVQPEAAALLKQIDYVPLSVVHLGLPRHQLAHPLDGFGALIPRNQGVEMLGSIWASQLFPARAPEGYALLANFWGGALHPEVVNRTDNELVRHTLDTLQHLLGPDTLVEGKSQPRLTPVFQRVVRYERAIPQYTQGHLSRIEKIETLLQDSTPQITLAGNYLRAISLEGCVVGAQKAVQQYVGGK